MKILLAENPRADVFDVLHHPTQKRPQAVAFARVLTTASSSWLRLISKPLPRATALSPRMSLTVTSPPEGAPSRVPDHAPPAADRESRLRATSSGFRAATAQSGK